MEMFLCGRRAAPYWLPTPKVAEAKPRLRSHTGQGCTALEDGVFLEQYCSTTYTTFWTSHVVFSELTSYS